MILPQENDNEHLLLGLLLLLSNRLQTTGDNFIGEITTKQWLIILVLRILSDREPTLNELAEAAGSSHQNVKQIILKLEKKGFVELRRDENDARKYRIRMTPYCEEFSRSFSDRGTKFIKQFLAHLEPEDLETTVRTLIKIKSNLEKMEGDYV
ncbi:MAG TPA: MarR family transcriptional regulator [Mobilitalea sp.]|nr:MarR family transcriptional regulator [Mobilitalea sp.]